MDVSYKSISVVPSNQELMDLGRWAQSLQVEGYKIAKSPMDGGEIEGLSITEEFLTDEEAAKVGKWLHEIWISGVYLLFRKDQKFWALNLKEGQVS